MSSFKTKNNYPTQINLFELSETITANIGVGVYIVQQGKFVYTSPIYRKLTGYAEHELIGVNSLEYVHPEDRDKVRQQAIKCLKGESSDSYEYRYIKKNGEIMWILEMITSIVYHGKRAALGSFMDITARKHMEEALRQSEERYRTVIEDIEEGYYEVDLQGNFTFASDSICATLGYTREELIGMSYKNYVPNEQFDYVYNIFKKVYETGKPIKSYSLINIRKNGERIHVEDSVAPL
ncbi:MAG TPA: PAS domain-containing protein, partial [Smithellaceae bacterium]|nr:PAS domain-containing protein [Smithellaceae bacterium]